MSQILLPLTSRPSFAQADYVTSKTSDIILESLLHPEKWNSHGCLLIGETGSGKTHLAHIWQEKFGAGYIGAGHFSELNARRLPPDDYLVVEAIDAPDIDIELLFHLLNAFRESNRKILLTACAQPSTFVTLPDVLSRLKALFTLQIPAPDEEVMRGIIRKLFSDRQLRVEEGVIEYILTRTERSYSALGTLIARLDDSALIRKQGVTVPLARQVLGTQE